MIEEDVIMHIKGRFGSDQFSYEKELVASFLIRYSQQYNTSLYGAFSLNILMDTARQWYTERTNVFKDIRNGFSIMQNSGYFFQNGDIIKLTEHLLSKIH